MWRRDLHARGGIRKPERPSRSAEVNLLSRLDSRIALERYPIHREIGASSIVKRLDVAFAATIYTDNPAFSTG
jgi:hypothetical protein